MTKFMFKRRKPENKRERIIETGAKKINRLITEQGLRITPYLKDKLNVLALNLADKHKVKITSSDILKKALEILYKDGVFSEKLEKEYIYLIAKEVTDTVAAGQALYQVLGKKMCELKRKDIEIDSKQIEQKVKAIIE